MWIQPVGPVAEKLILWRTSGANQARFMELFMGPVIPDLAVLADLLCCRVALHLLMTSTCSQSNGKQIAFVGSWIMNRTSPLRQPAFRRAHSGCLKPRNSCFSMWL